MTHLPAMVFLLDAAAKKSSSSLLTFLPLILIALAGYFFFIKPQQRKAQAARAGAATPYEVGDEVQTIGGVIGTILEIHGDRYTLLTGHTESDGNLDGPQPTRIVFIRQAIARKVERIVDVVDDEDSSVIDDAVDDEPGQAPRQSPGKSLGKSPGKSFGKGRKPESFDIGDHDHQGDEEAEEA
jgi:preprotein translocase subunit YajC